MSPTDLEQLLQEVDEERRGFIRKMIFSSAYALPIVSTFTMAGLPTDSMAQVLCTSSNMMVSNTVDLAIEKTVAPDPAVAGDQVTYTITVTNQSGFGEACDVRFEDNLPIGATFVSAQQTGGTAMFNLNTPMPGDEGGVVVGEASEVMADGEVATFEIVLRVNP